MMKAGIKKGLAMKALKICLAIVTAALTVSTHAQQPPLQDFADVHPIDAHVHVYVETPALNAFLLRNNLHFVDIVVLDDRDPFYKSFQAQYGPAQSLARGSKGHVAVCTSFSPYDFEQPGFADRAIRQLNENFKQGAVAVKIYKTIGMEIKKKDGTYLMPDDPVFQPIYQDIAAQNRTVIAHLAEPTSCWQPPNPSSPDFDYYKGHPEEYAYAHPEWPSKEAILAARDRMLKQNPKLRVVGAHLGSMEVDVDEIAKHFDQYPNFAVDTAARVQYLTLQPSPKVRKFLIKYQDRVLYGTDTEIMPDSNVDKVLSDLQDTYALDWKYFATKETFDYKGHKVTGLALPKPVLRKLYHENAVHWFPGILAEPANVNSQR
jgi:hypothetical protein